MREERTLPEAPIWADCVMTGVVQDCQGQFQKFLLWFGSVDLIGKAEGEVGGWRGPAGTLRKVNEIFPLLQRISRPLVLYHWMSVFSAGDDTLPP